jgi:hypothetical protein
MTDAHRTVLLFISVAKRWLQGELSVAERLYILEWIDARADMMITPAVIAAIEPADDVSLEIVSEALRLSLAADDNGSATFAVLERETVAGDLLALNPSITQAIRLCKGHAVAT